SRANDLNSLMDGMMNGIQTLEAADNGLTAMTKTLESMQSTLRQARQDKSFQTESYEVELGTDGTFAAALFQGPVHMTTDGTSIYFAEYVNNKIRKLQ
ncbi:MAG: hypothetical protein SFU98_20970, partial [Leptospiraceae bacterium]|nr:hypothetical protein [Leptospiraceae bacterium]